MRKRMLMFVTLALFWVDCFAQEDISEVSEMPPKILGLSVLAGGVYSNLSNFNSSMRSFGFEEVNELSFSGGLLFNFLETEKFSYSFSLEFTAVKELSRSVGPTNDGRSIKLYSTAFMFNPGGTFFARAGQRMQFFFGFGMSWSLLTAGEKSQTYGEFIEGDYTANDDLSQYSLIVRPAFRYEYWLSNQLPVGIMAGYSFPLVADDWSNSNVPIFTQGFTVHDGPRTSFTGWFLMLQIPLVTYLQN